jgi:membrane protein YdfJ
MAKFLYRMGKRIYHNRLVFLIGWIIILAAALIAGTVFKGPVSNAFSIPGTKAQEALDLLNKEFPQANGGTVRIIFSAAQGQTLDSSGSQQAIKSTLDETKKDPGVLAVLDPYQTGTFSRDKTIGFADVIYKLPAKQVDKASKTHILDTIEISRKGGLQTELGGSVEVTELKIGGITNS